MAKVRHIHSESGRSGAAAAVRDREDVALRPSAGLDEIPLDRAAVAAAIAAIPSDRDPELLREMNAAVSSGDANRARLVLARWMMIGSFYADPDREANHPLGRVLGQFKDEPLLERLAEAIARGRSEESNG